VGGAGAVKNGSDGYRHRHRLASPPVCAGVRPRVTPPAHVAGTPARAGVQKLRRRVAGGRFAAVDGQACGTSARPPLRPRGAAAGLRELRRRTGEHRRDADEPRCHAGVAGWGMAVGGENQGRSVTESKR